MSGLRVVENGSIRMAFDANKWKYSSTDSHLVLGSGDFEMHFVSQFFNDGDYGTRGNRVYLNNAISQQIDHKLGGMKDGAVVWVPTNKTTTNALPDGSFAYRCNGSTLRVTLGPPDRLTVLTLQRG